MTSVESIILFVTVAFIGACFGSLINVVIYRYPKMMEREWLSECLGFLREYLFDKKIPLQPKPLPVNQDKSVNDEAISSPITPSEPFPWIDSPQDQKIITLIQEIEEAQKNKFSDETFNLSIPRSHCPTCHAMIPWYRNIPLFTWLSQFGRAHCCGTKISSRYFLVEVAGAALTTLAIGHFGLTVQGGLAAIFLLMLLTLAGIDWETRLLPDSFTLSLMWIGLLVNLYPFFAYLPDAVIGAAAGYGVLWLLYQTHHIITGREGMGFGDFKLTAAFGAWLGWKSLPIILVIAAVIGIIGALSTFRVRGNPRAEPIPFGPSLCIAATIYLFYGHQIIFWLGY